MSLLPMPGYVLVELEGNYKHVTATSKVYESATKGIIRSLGTLGDNPLSDYLVERMGSKGEYRAYWSDMMAGNPIVQDGKGYVFVRIDRLEGYENVE